MAPDESYMVISENSTVIIEDYWSGNFKSILNVMLGHVRFYIKRFGGRPSPYSVRTPTALIAVRGTIFDVLVDSDFSEVRCLEGQVKVETAGLPEREVVLDPVYKTLVRFGEAPLTPVRLEAELQRNRTVAVRIKSAPDADSKGAPSINVLANDNDRRNRQSDPQRSNSRTNENLQRAKPGTLSFPR
jgi:hypothetical protein